MHIALSRARLVRIVQIAAAWPCPALPTCMACMLHLRPTCLLLDPQQVYLALWHETEVACKVLVGGGGSAGIASSGDAEQALALASPIMQKLEEEAGLLAALRHPNVVQFCESPPLQTIVVG